jgi:hypothetical protein
MLAQAAATSGPDDFGSAGTYIRPPAGKPTSLDNARHCAGVASVDQLARRRFLISNQYA